MSIQARAVFMQLWATIDVRLLDLNPVAFAGPAGTYTRTTNK
jgi:ppGpp synthetase/RelA/SpoT-type nucleotidyltranferase